jgi:hypothetical protein
MLTKLKIIITLAIWFVSGAVAAARAANCPGVNSKCSPSAAR